VSARRCSSTETKKGYCNAYALADSDPPLCHFHSMGLDERQAWRARGGKARQQQQRLRADREERLDGIAFGVGPEHILKTCLAAMDAKLVTGEIDWGARLSACCVLLQVFPKSLRMTPEEARDLLVELLDGTRQRRLADIAVKEHFKRLRAEWFETMTRVDALGHLYAVAVPPMLLGPGDTAESVRRELPDFDGWKTEPLHDDAGRDIGFARVTRPDGSTALVQRDSTISQRDAA
jgi:hypothetical protein